MSFSFVTLMIYSFRTLLQSYKVKLLKNNYYLLTILFITSYNLYNFYIEALYLFVFLFVFVLLIYKKIDTKKRYILLYSFLFTNLLNLIIPPRPVFSGNQFAYFDEQFYQSISFVSDMYSNDYFYIGFTFISKMLLLTNNLINLNVFLYFLNVLVFYGIYSFYFSINKKSKNVNLFTLLLLIFFIAINLPSNFNQLIGFPKLFLNGTSGFGSFGIRVFTPASFDLLVFYPLNYLLNNKVTKAFFSGILISLFHYYLFTIVLAFLFCYFLRYKEKKYYFYYTLLPFLVFFKALESLDYIKNIGNLINLIRPISVNFNLVPYFSFGTILNSGRNSDYIYYIDLFKLNIFKPEFLYNNFSPTLGVINNESSIPIEKIIFFLFALHLSSKYKNNLINYILFVFINVFLVSHLLFSNNIFSYLGIVYPWRVSYFASIISFLVISSKVPEIKFNIQKYYFVITVFLIASSFYIWNIHDTKNYSYNDNLKNLIELEVEEGELIIIPIEETRYLFHYNLPNIFIWLYPPIDLKDLDKTTKYFEKLRIYNLIINSKNCQELNDNLEKTTVIVEKIIFKSSSPIYGQDCSVDVLFYEN